MDAKFERRKQELLDECTVEPQVFARVMPRLERFMRPFDGEQPDSTALWKNLRADSPSRGSAMAACAYHILP